MATVGETLAISYARAKAQNPSLRKGQYMQKVFGGRYKNEQSAYQAYNQTVKGRRSGEKLGKLSHAAQPPIQNPEIREQVRTGQIKRRPRPGMSQRGLWKINVIFHYEDDKGNPVQDPESRSFIATSIDYTELFDIPYIEETIAASVDEYVDKWDMEYSLGNYTRTTIEVIPIYRHDSSNVVDIDDTTILLEDWPE